MTSFLSEFLKKKPVCVYIFNGCWGKITKTQILRDDFQGIKGLFVIYKSYSQWNTMENTVQIIEQNYRKNKYVKYKNIYVTSVNWIFCSNIHNFFCILCHWTFQRMWNVTKTKHAVRTSLLWLSETFKIFRHKTTSLIKNILWWWHVNKKYLWLPAWDRGGVTGWWKWVITIKKNTDDSN